MVCFEAEREHFFFFTTNVLNIVNPCWDKKSMKMFTSKISQVDQEEKMKNFLFSRDPWNCRKKHRHRILWFQEGEACAVDNFSRELRKLSSLCVFEKLPLQNYYCTVHGFLQLLSTISTWSRQEGLTKLVLPYIWLHRKPTKFFVLSNQR